MIEEGWTIASSAESMRISRQTAHKWWRRYREAGEAGLEVRSSQAPVSRSGPRRGDLVLSHYLTGHNKGGNTGGHVRRTIYFRLAVPGHAGRWEQTFLDPLIEFMPVRHALGG